MRGDWRGNFWHGRLSYTRLMWIRVVGGGGVEQDVVALCWRVEFVAVWFYGEVVDIIVRFICSQRGGLLAEGRLVSSFLKSCHRFFG